MLDDLKASNRAWAARMISRDAGFFKRLERLQTPEYLWIGCSDAEYLPIRLWMWTPGRSLSTATSLTSHRLRTPITSVLQFAVDVLRVRHIIVWGTMEVGE